MENINFLELVERTRSVRCFDQSKKVSSETLRELVQIGRMTASARNIQPLKYITVTDESLCDKIFWATGCAAALADGRPKEGERPTGYIVIYQDKNIAQNSMWDQGIVSYTIMLGATTKELGGCIIASIYKDKFPDLGVDDNIEPAIVLALGVPQEDIRVVEMKDGNFNYYRDELNVHFVPKRSIEEVLIKEL